MVVNPDILLLHGALGAADQLRPLEEELAKERKVARLNLTGHGGAPIPEQPFRMGLFAQDILDWMLRNQEKKVDIFGYSMGGYAALQLACTYPEKVNRIVTLGTKFDWNPESSEREARRLNPEKLEEKVPAFALELKKRHGYPNWGIILDKTAEMMRDLGQGNRLHPEDLAQIEHPVRLGIGDGDKMVSLAETETVAKQLPNSEVSVFSGFQHPIEQVDVKVLAASILEWL